MTIEEPLVTFKREGYKIAIGSLLLNLVFLVLLTVSVLKHLPLVEDGIALGGTEEEQIAQIEQNIKDQEDAYYSDHQEYLHLIEIKIDGIRYRVDEYQTFDNEFGYQAYIIRADGQEKNFGVGSQAINKDWYTPVIVNPQI